MGLESVVPGQYEARATDWGLSEVEALGNAIQAHVKFAFKDQADQDHEITWKGFLMKKDGGKNKKTFDTVTLLAPKCVGEDGEIDFVSFMSPDAIDTTKAVNITVVDQAAKSGKVYKNVEWVNELGGGSGSSSEFYKTPEKKMGLAERLVAEGLGKKAKGQKKAAAAPKPKNFAPGAEDDELPF